MKAKEVQLIHPSTLYLATRGLKITSDSDINETKVTDYEELKRKLRNCQDEIYKLQAANSDLTQVNKRWHKYNSDMQIFIDKLQSTIRDQQEQINSIGEDHSYTYRRVETNNECDKLKCRRQREEVIKLKEEIEHLKFQVRAHKDDWEAEKLEKQEALNEKNALQTRLNDVLRDICNSNRNLSGESSRRSQGCPCCKQWNRNNLEYSSGFNQTMSTKSPHHLGRYYFTDENIECDTSKQSTKGNLSPDIDEKPPRPKELLLINDDQTLEGAAAACSLRPREESYSTVTTLPSSSITQSRADSPVLIQPSHTPRQQATTLAMGIKTGSGATLTSFVRLPVVKSYSAPEGSLATTSNVRLNSISLSVVPSTSSGLSAISTVTQSQQTPNLQQSQQQQPPRSLPSSVNNLSDDENIACPRCHEVFICGRHLDFIDHLEQCQRDSE